MSSNNLLTKTVTFPSAQSNLRIEKTRELATQAGCSEAIAPILESMQELNRESIQISIIGGRNSGKSNFVNCLLEVDILPVTTLDTNKEFYLKGVNNIEDEGFYLTDSSECYLIEQLSKNDLVTNSEPGSINIDLSHQWLTEHNFNLLEKPAFDVSGTEVEKALGFYLGTTDCVVFIIDALMSLRKNELYLISESIRRQIPTIVVINKLDKLEREDREEVIEYVNKNLPDTSNKFQIIPALFSEPNTSQSEKFKLAIEGIISQTEIAELRERQLTKAIYNSLMTINSQVQAIVAICQKQEAKKTQAIKKRQQEFNLQNLAWQQIELNLQNKRRNLDDKLRGRIQKKQLEILDVLYYDLKRSNDMRTWWERDLSFRLEQEFKSLDWQFERLITQQFSNDLQWLEQEVSQRLKYPLKIVTESNVAMEKPSVETQEIALSNSNHLKIISRVGTAVCVVMSAIVLSPLAITGTGIAASALAGITIEQLLTWNTEKEREKVRQELSKVIDRVEREYVKEISHQLKEAYNQIATQLKQNQMHWQQTQLQALMKFKRSSMNKSTNNWKEIEQEITRLMTEIKGMQQSKHQDG